MYDGLSMPGGERWGLLKEKKNGGVRVNMEHHTSPPKKNTSLKRNLLEHQTLPIQLYPSPSKKKIAKKSSHLHLPRSVPLLG